MSNEGLDLDALRAMRTTVFAPLVQQLEINPTAITNTGAKFEIPASDYVIRTGDIVCGQAVAAIADTVGVMALFAHNEEQRIMTTVDMTTHFMRPLLKGMMEAEAFIQSNGKRMANVRVEIRQQGSEKLAGSTTCAYVYV